MGPVACGWGPMWHTNEAQWHTDEAQWHRDGAQWYWLRPSGTRLGPVWHTEWGSVWHTNEAQWHTDMRPNGTWGPVAHEWGPMWYTNGALRR